jgi:hypothetical protein
MPYGSILMWLHQNFSLASLRADRLTEPGVPDEAASKPLSDMNHSQMVPSIGYHLLADKVS